MFEKIQLRDNAQIESIRIKNKINLYRYALNAAKDYYNGYTRYNGIQDALSRGLINSYLNKNRNYFNLRLLKFVFNLKLIYLPI